MIDKELLYDKAYEIMYLCWKLRDIEIDDEYYKKPLEEMGQNFDITIDWLNHMLGNEIVGPKK